MRIFITGITGFLGSNLAHHLALEGHEVFGSCQRGVRPPTCPTPMDRISTLVLGESFDAAALAGMDMIIHAAHDFSVHSFERNVRGTREVFQAAKLHSSPRQIFVSSYSARPNAATEYGRIKYTLEQVFLSERQTIVRPGVVIGNGGLFGRAVKAMLRLPVIPLVDGGSDLIPVIGIGDFLRAMRVIIGSSEPGAYNLFYESLPSLRALLELLNRKAGHRVLYLNLPLGWAIVLQAGASKLGFTLPIGADQLKSLKRNRQCLHRSDLKDLVSSPASLDDVVEAALAFRQDQ